jgi:glycosyltransferase involved in cell wall biosynthesis
MDNFTLITPLIITFNEAPNIGRSLEKLRWAKRIVVIDSFSTDGTLAILAQYPQVEVFQRKFISFADQCNFGLQQIDTEWVLSMDSDYILDDSFIAAIQNATLDVNQIAAYYARFKYAIFGKPVRCGIYPPRKVLYAKERAYYINDGHGHTVLIEGALKNLEGFIYHDDRKSFSHWLVTQDRYLQKEADKLTQVPFNRLKFADKLRWFIFLAPFTVFIYCWILRGGFMDGKRGWHYTTQRVLAEILLSIRLTEARFGVKTEKRKPISDTRYGVKTEKKKPVLDTGFGGNSDNNKIIFVRTNLREV